MLLESIQFEKIKESHLQAMVDSATRESKTVEYKQMLPGNSDGEKKEFLFDVSSFANASGGFLIYGIKEEAGVPKELCGLGAVNADAEIRRLDSIILSGIEPRLPGLQVR